MREDFKGRLGIGCVLNDANEVDFAKGLWDHNPIRSLCLYRNYDWTGPNSGSRACFDSINSANLLAHYGGRL